MLYAEIILPLSLEKNYTFGVPLEFQQHIQIGMRVEVQFGKKRIYSGVVKSLHSNKPDMYDIKPIRSILDEEPLVTEQQLAIWQWIAAYYSCTEGDVMKASLPSYLKLESETFISIADELDINELDLSDDEYMVLQALQVRKEELEKAKLSTNKLIE